MSDKATKPQSPAAAFALVLRMAEAHANGHEHCLEILAAVKRCKEGMALLKLGKKP